MSAERRPQRPADLDQRVLEALASGGRHGFAILEQMCSATDDLREMEEGQLYPVLHRMESCGWIISSWEPVEEGRRARLYRLTRAGRRRASQAAPSRGLGALKPREA